MAERDARAPKTVPRGSARGRGEASPKRGREAPNAGAEEAARGRSGDRACGRGAVLRPVPEAAPEPAGACQEAALTEARPAHCAPHTHEAGAREAEEAQADHAHREARVRAGPAPGAPRRRRLRQGRQDDHRQGRRDQEPSEVQEGRPPTASSMRTTRRTPPASATPSASSRRGRSRRPKRWRLAEIVEKAK